MDGIIESGRTMMNSRQEITLAHAYLSAKQMLLASTYRNEVLFFPNDSEELSESDFLRELAWVILSAGMAEAVVRKKFPAISNCFLGWASALSISASAEECVSNALCHFRHQGKINAIASAAAIVSAARSFCELKQRILRDPINELQIFPYIGPITAFHVAKNIGVRVAKPDRHLTRLAVLCGFNTVDDLCWTISSFLGEDIRLVDSVLWRFSAMHPDYLARFSNFMTS